MKTIKTVEALYEYLSDNDGELSFRAGDIITITGIADDNWYYGFLRDEWGIMRKGVVAKPYVKVLVTVPPKPGSPHEVSLNSDPTDIPNCSHLSAKDSKTLECEANHESPGTAEKLRNVFAEEEAKGVEIEEDDAKKYKGEEQEAKRMEDRKEGEKVEEEQRRQNKIAETIANRDQLGIERADQITFRRDKIFLRQIDSGRKSKPRSQEKGTEQSILLQPLSGYFAASIQYNQPISSGSSIDLFASESEPVTGGASTPLSESGCQGPSLKPMAGRVLRRKKTPNIQTKNGSAIEAVIEFTHNRRVAVVKFGWEKDLYALKIFLNEEAFEAERDAYEALKDLQGHTLPFFYGSFEVLDYDTKAVIAKAILLEYIHSSSCVVAIFNRLTLQNFPSVFKYNDQRLTNMVYHAVGEVHSRNRVHNDLSGVGNILYVQGEQPYVVFVDWEFSMSAEGSRTDADWSVLHRACME